MIDLRKRWDQLGEDARTIPSRVDHWRREAMADDIKAGLSVGVMLIPQAMAYAVLAGLPPQVGLYASLVPLIVYAAVGSSRRVAFGINAVDMLILGAGLSRIDLDGPGQWMGLGLAACILVGITQLVMSALRLDFLVDFLARPVITGFMTAAPVLIALSQLDGILGVDAAAGELPYQDMIALLKVIPETNWWALGLGLGCMAGMLALRKIKRELPAALIVVILATLVSWWFDFEARGVEVLGEVAAGLPVPALPEVSLVRLRELLPTVVTLALVQFMTLISLSKSLAERAGDELNTSRELRALGLGNVSSGLFGGAPVSASFSRSAINWSAGAETSWSNAVTALTVLAALLLLQDAFALIPSPALAAIILVAALGMIDWRETRILFEIARQDGWVALLTTATTLLLGVQEGVLLGVGATMVLMAWERRRPEIIELGRDPITGRWIDLREEGFQASLSDALILRVDGSLSFVNADYVADFVVGRLAKDASLETVILDGRAINHIDATAIASLKRLEDSLLERGVLLELASFKEGPREVIERSGFCDDLTRSCFHDSPDEALRDGSNGYDSWPAVESDDEEE